MTKEQTVPFPEANEHHYTKEYKEKPMEDYNPAAGAVNCPYYAREGKMSKYINAEDLKKSFRDDLEKMYPLMGSESTRKLAIDVINGVCKDIDEFPAAEVVPRQNIEAAIDEIAEKHSHTWTTGEKFTNIYALDIIEIIKKHAEV